MFFINHLKTLSSHWYFRNNFVEVLLWFELLRGVSKSLVTRMPFIIRSVIGLMAEEVIWCSNILVNKMNHYWYGIYVIVIIIDIFKQLKILSHGKYRSFQSLFSIINSCKNVPEVVTEACQPLDMNLQNVPVLPVLYSVDQIWGHVHCIDSSVF